MKVKILKKPFMEDSLIFSVVKITFEKSVGCGFLVESKDSVLVLTAKHVLPENHNNFNVFIADSNKIFNLLVETGNVKRTEGKEDLALIEIKSKLPENIKPLRLCHEKGSRDRKIFTIGFPPKLQNDNSIS